MKRIAQMVILVWLFLSPALTVAQSADEPFLAYVPPDYTLTSQQIRGDKTELEFVPRGQSSANWTEMLKAQSLARKNWGTAWTEVDKVYEWLKAQWLTACKKGTMTKYLSSSAKDYPSAFWIMQCPHSRVTRKPEVALFRAIESLDALYVVQETFKFKPTAEQTTRWEQYLLSLRACSGGLVNDKCPPPATGQPSISGAIAVLSDTEGVDLGPYLLRTIKTVRDSWDKHIPPEARPPQLTKGSTRIEFHILPDGRVDDIRVADESGHIALDSAARDAIVACGPFPPLPTEFHGPHLALRFQFLYNPEQSKEH